VVVSDLRPARAAERPEREPAEEVHRGNQRPNHPVRLAGRRGQVGRPRISSTKPAIAPRKAAVRPEFSALGLPPSCRRPSCTTADPTTAPGNGRLAVTGGDPRPITSPMQPIGRGGVPPSCPHTARARCSEDTGSRPVRDTESPICAPSHVQGGSDLPSSRTGPSGRRVAGRSYVCRPSVSADAQPYLGARAPMARRHDGRWGDPARSGAAARSFRAGHGSPFRQRFVGSRPQSINVTRARRVGEGGPIRRVAGPRRRARAGCGGRGG
jgi:hypothetical protein